MFDIVIESQENEKDKIGKQNINMKSLNIKKYYSNILN